VTLSEVGYEYTAHVLTKDLGFKFMGQDGSRFRFQIGETKTVSRNKNGKQVYYGSDIVDLLCLPDARYGLWA
jgi:glyoxalase family protein